MSRNGDAFVLCSTGAVAALAIPSSLRAILIVAAFLVLLILWQFRGVIWILFHAAEVKEKVIDSVETSYTFPAVTPEQFPLLDSAALDQYTREFEKIGFTRLLDFSLVANTRKPIPSFARLMVNTRYHCFAEINQIFPEGHSPIDLKCAIMSQLRDGWSISFTDRKPLAAMSLIRRRKAIGVAMLAPEPAEIFEQFLKMREQVCSDLGIQPLAEDTLEAYFDRVQRSVIEMKEAMQEKDFTVGLSEYYYRKLSLVKTNPEYVWLGDYPKEAEQRKQGYTMGAATQ